MNEPYDDGSIEVDLGPDPDPAEVDLGGPEQMSGEGHDDNLAEYLPDDVLADIATTCLDGFEIDIRSRDDWAKAYIKGLDLMGMKIEDRQEPWPGASGVYHPILSESVIKFQAQAMSEIFPASGPARTKIMGKMTTEMIDQAQRVENEMNYLLTEKMPEYRDETEMMLFRLPLAGSAFKKIYYDPIEKRPCAVFVPAEDFVVNYGASDLKGAVRYTHVMKKTEDQVKKIVSTGFWRDVELGEPRNSPTDIQVKYDEMSGTTSAMNDDKRHTLLEIHLNLSIEGLDDQSSPYVVTIDKDSKEVLSVRRNWYQDDEYRCKRMHFTHYRYLPGMGFYGIGLIHLLGGLTKSATSILRQLIDAGTLANLPAGLKSRGLRIKGDNTPFYPGEFRDVDVGSGAIRDHVHFLPYKEPSAVLYQLLGNVTEEARRIGSIADIEIESMSSQAPVGTTLALMERSMKVMSGVQARLHASLKVELRLIAKIVADHMGPEYEYDVGGSFNRQQDFSDKVDVIPVSDPNAATMAQRIVQYQAALQLAQGAPQLYDMGKLHRQMLGVLGIQDADDIIKLPEDIKPMDPVTENMAILKQEPVKAFQYQDHQAHLQVHMAASQDPKILQIVGQSPFASAIQSAMQSHITEHVAMMYRTEIEQQLGVSLPDPEAPLPEDVEREISRMAALAADKLLGKHQAEAAAEEAQRQAEDPLTQIQLRELAIKEARLKLDEQIAMGQLELEKQRNDMNIDIQRERIEAENQRKGAEIGARVATAIDSQQSRERTEAQRIAVEAARVLAEQDSRVEVGE